MVTAQRPRPSEIDPNWRKRPRVWTPEKLYRLEDLLGEGLSDAGIGRRLNVSANAVKIARKKAGIPCRTEAFLNCRTVAQMLGLPQGDHTVRWWVTSGWLAGRQGQRRGGNRQWFITEEAVLAFLQDSAHWHRWNPARIPDPDLRAYAEQIQGDRYLSTGMVAARYHVGHGTVNKWIYDGLLPAVKHGPNWRIRERDLEGWTVPGDRPRFGRRGVWTEEERQQVWAGIEALAAQFGRHPKQVAYLAAKLALRKRVA